MTSAEFGEWLVYDQMSPGDPERGDLQAAVVAMTIANAHKGKKGKPFEIKDFLLRFKDRRPVAKTPKELKIKLTSWLSVCNKNRGD